MGLLADFQKEEESKREPAKIFEPVKQKASDNYLEVVIAEHVKKDAELKEQFLLDFLKENKLSIQEFDRLFFIRYERSVKPVELKELSGKDYTGLTSTETMYIALKSDWPEVFPNA